MSAMLASAVTVAVAFSFGGTPDGAKEDTIQHLLYRTRNAVAVPEDMNNDRLISVTICVN